MAEIHVAPQQRIWRLFVRADRPLVRTTRALRRLVRQAERDGLVVLPGRARVVDTGPFNVQTRYSRGRAGGRSWYMASDLGRFRQIAVTIEVVACDPEHRDVVTAWATALPPRGALPRISEFTEEANGDEPPPSGA